MQKAGERHSKRGGEECHVRGRCELRVYAPINMFFALDVGRVVARGTRGKSGLERSTSWWRRLRLPTAAGMKECDNDGVRSCV